MVRFIADLHFGHENMIRNNRGFPDAFHHDENIVAQWNLTCHKRDVIYILGDITMEKNDYRILDRLIGIKHVILGNHDKLNCIKFLRKYVNGIGGMYKYKSKQFGGHRFLLTHCPIHPMELDVIETNGIKVFNIHGHIHDGYAIKDHRYINVCAEKIDYKPKTLEELLQGY